MGLGFREALWQAIIPNLYTLADYLTMKEAGLSRSWTVTATFDE